MTKSGLDGADLLVSLYLLGQWVTNPYYQGHMWKRPSSPALAAPSDFSYQSFVLYGKIQYKGTKLNKNKDC